MVPAPTEEEAKTADSTTTDLSTNKIMMEKMDKTMDNMLKASG